MGCGGGGWRAPERYVPPAQPAAAPPEDPIAILKMRLARGEITLEEYERILAVLKGDRP